jgi:hypothetical protein
MPRKRTIEILPSGVGDFSILYSPRVRFYMSVRRFTVSDYPLVSWKFSPLHCLIFDLRFLIILWYLESFHHYIVWSLTYAFWLPFGILKVFTITLFDLWLTLSDYPLVSWKFWPLHCLIFDLRFLITLWYLESFDHYIVWSLTYAFWLPFGILTVLTITLFDLWLTLSDYPLVSWQFWPLRCMIFDLRFLILTVFTITLFDLWLTLSDYPLVSWQFWPLHCLIFDLRFLITLWYLESFDHYIVWSLTYAFWSWQFWPLHCLIFDLRFLITLWYLESFDHYIVWSLTYAFWLPFGILKLLAITLFDLWLTLSDYPLVSWKFSPLHCLIFDLRFLITLWYLETFGHYIVWSLTYAFWLLFGILKVFTITLFDLWLTLSDYPSVSWKFWPLHCLIFDLRFLIILWYLESFHHYSVVF